MRTITLADALQMLADCFEADVGSLTASTAREAIAGWDSMGALALMAELDDRFDLALTAQESRDMRSVGDALSYLRAHHVLAD